MMIEMVPNQPMHEVGEVPSRHCASVPVTDVAANICFSTLFCFDKKQEQQQTWKVTTTSFSGGGVLWMPLLHGYFYAEVLVCGKHIFWPFRCFMISVWIQPPVWSKVATEWWLGILTWRNPCRRAACHHGEDEDDDAEDEGQVGESPHSVHHDRQDVV